MEVVILVVAITDKNVSSTSKTYSVYKDHSAFIQFLIENIFPLFHGACSHQRIG